MSGEVMVKKALRDGTELNQRLLAEFVPVTVRIGS
jgi:hypothetical protein